MADPSSTFTAPTPLTVSAGNARASTYQSSSDSPTTPTSTSTGRKRNVSITQSILEAKAPPGIWAAMGEEIARGPGIAELRRLSSGSIKTRRALARRRSSGTTVTSSPTSPTHGRLGSISQHGDENENAGSSVKKSTNYAQLPGSGSGGAGGVTTTSMLLPETGIEQGQPQQRTSIITAPPQAQFPAQQGPGVPGPSSSAQSPISPPTSPLSFQFAESDEITVARPNIHSETDDEFKTPPASPTNTTYTAATTERKTKAKGSLFFEELEETPSIESDLRRKNTRRVKGVIVGTGAGSSIRGSIGGERPGSPEVMSRGGILGGQEDGHGSAISVLEIEKPLVLLPPPITGSILSMPPLQSPEVMEEKTEPALQRTVSEISSTPARSVISADYNDGGPQKPPWWKVTGAGLKKFFWWFLTPMGFFITIYMANIIAWGGMLFLLLVNAAPAMCASKGGDCNHINSARRIWVEIDSQILNALFCVTGFGLIPWRFRDAYYLLQYRMKKSTHHLDKLAQVHEGWFQPSRGTKTWKLDTVVWLYVANTFLQVALSGLMWGMTRYDRPAWATGLLVALACGVAGGAGGVVWWEGRRLKKLEDQENGARTDDEEIGMVGREKKNEPIVEKSKGKEVQRGDSGMAEKGVSRGGTDLSEASTAGEAVAGGVRGAPGGKL